MACFFRWCSLGLAPRHRLLFFLPFLVVGCVISSVLAWVPELELELLVVLLVVLEVV